MSFVIVGGGDGDEGITLGFLSGDHLGFGDAVVHHGCVGMRV